MLNHLQVAILQIGVIEDPKGSNSGVKVNEYLKSVGLPAGNSWCMAFVYWCCKETNPATPLFKTGGVLKQWAKVDSKYKVSTPQPGDIFIMNFGKGLGHTGFIESVDGDYIKTIEGNATTVSGSREGIEVCRKRRKISSCIGFIRVN